MCIAILSPKGTQLSKESLNNCWLNNYNGAGFMYNDDNNVLRVVKELKSFDKFYKKYKSIRGRFPDSTMLIHFRISTHGIINKANCHPFKVNNTLGFIHNGVIHDVEEDTKYSDTNMFNRTVLRKIPGLSVELMNSKGMKKLVGELIGRSKLVFMDNNNNYSIVLGSTNDNKGHWGDDGVWYSNDSYKEVKDTIDFGGKSISRGSFGGGSYGSGSYGSDRYGSGAGYRSKWGSSTYNSGAWKDGEYLTDDTSSKKYSNNLFGKFSNLDYSYKISDGSCTCDSCGIPLLTGELTSIFDECLECLTVEEAWDIKKAATCDNYILENYSGTSVVITPDTPSPSTSEEDTNKGNSQEEYSECDYCTTVLPKSEVAHVKVYDACLCKNCVTSMIEFKYLEPDTIDLFSNKKGANA